jgi:hypothetical protein
MSLGYTECKQLIDSSRDYFTAFTHIKNSKLSPTDCFELTCRSLKKYGRYHAVGIIYAHYRCHSSIEELARVTDATPGRWANYCQKVPSTRITRHLIEKAVEAEPKLLEIEVIRKEVEELERSDPSSTESKKPYKRSAPQFPYELKQIYHADLPAEKKFQELLNLAKDYNRLNPFWVVYAYYRSYEKIENMPRQLGIGVKGLTNYVTVTRGKERRNAPRKILELAASLHPKIAEHPLVIDFLGLPKATKSSQKAVDAHLAKRGVAEVDMPVAVIGSPAANPPLAMIKMYVTASKSQHIGAFLEMLRSTAEQKANTDSVIKSLESWTDILKSAQEVGQPLDHVLSILEEANRV